MPIISAFYGIQIAMYFKDTAHHHLPHIHVRYSSYKAAVSIVDAAVLAGNLPLRQQRLVQCWVNIHRHSLLVNWELARQGKPLYPVPPLP